MSFFFFFWLKKHQFYIYFNNDQNRSNEKRFEHIASKRHELKVSDIELIEKGINNYFYFEKNKSLKGTYHYYIKRKGNNKGFIKVAIRLIKEKTKKYYVKTIFIVYQIKKL